MGIQIKEEEKETFIDLEDFLKDTEYDPIDTEIHVYINDVPIGFAINELTTDFDGSIQIHIRDETLKVIE